MDRLVRRAQSQQVTWLHLMCMMTMLLFSGSFIATQPIAAQEPAPAVAAPAETLHVAIDRLLTASMPHLSAKQAADGVFLRRLSLDLRGTVPTGEELAAFKADQAPNKRATWVDRFMADPLHQERMVDWLDKTFMHRRPFATVDRNAWLIWLRDSVEAKVPLHTLVNQMLTASWWNNSQRPALRFFLDRGGDPHMITRDLSRVLMGRDMQCNQCHDHPSVNEYKQFDYHGMLAFVSASGLAEGTTKDDKGADVKSQMYVERPGSDAPFESVFEKGVALRSGPRLPVSQEIFSAYLDPDMRLQTEPSAGTFTAMPKAPMQSRRALLADQLIKQQPQVLARNFANRVWAIAFGRGLVHPVDMHHADNPASHPELLELITKSLLDSQFNYDQLLKQLVLSQAYGRDSAIDFKPWPIAEGPVEQGTAELTEVAQAATALKEKLTAELTIAQAADKASEQAMETVSVTWREAQASRNTARIELDKSEAVFVDAKKKNTDALVVHQTAAKKHQDTIARIALLDEAQAKIQQAMALAGGAADAELTAAITTSKTRADAARAELPALEKVATDTKTAADALLPAVEAQRAKVKEMAAALEVQQQNLAGVDTNYATVRQAWAKAHLSVGYIDKQIQGCDNCLTLVQMVHDARAAVTQTSSINTQFVAEQAKFPALDVQLQQTTDALAAGTKLQADNNATLAASKQALANHEAELAQLREALVQLDKATKLVAMPDPLKAAQLAINETLAAKSSATAGLTATIAQAEQSVANATTALAALQAARTTAEQTRTAQLAAIAGKKSELDAQTTKLDELKGKAREAWDSVLTDQRIQLSMSTIRALSPEQLGHSLLRVTGIFDNYVTNELAELQKNAPLPAEADEAAKAKRQLQAVRGADDKLRGNIDTFASLYASGAGQTADDYFASPDQALFMANGGAVFPWSGPNGQNITARMIAQKDNAAAAQDLYNTLVAREPSPSEISFVNEGLTAAADARPAVSQEIVWAMLTSVEFRFYQ